MNDSNTLRTQYVEELNDYKTQLKDILLKFGEDVTDKTGLNELVEKVNTTKGSEVLPFYKFANCESVETQKFINSVNLSFQKDLSNCFAHWHNPDLSNINTTSGENFDKFVYIPTLDPSKGGYYLDTITLGPGFILTNAKSLNYFLAGTTDLYWGDDSDRGIRVIDKGVKKQTNYNEITINNFMAYSGFGDRYNTRPGRNAKEAAEIFKKLRFENVKTLDNFCYRFGVSIGDFKDSGGEEIGAVEFGNFIDTVLDASLNLENVESIENFFRDARYLTTQNTNEDDNCDVKIFPKVKQTLKKLTELKGICYSTTIDCVNFSNWTFPNVETISSCFSAAASGQSESYKYIHLGYNPNPTLKKLVSLGYSASIHTLDMSGWNLEGVNTLDSTFYGPYFGGITFLWFGYGLGKGYTAQSNNYGRYSITLERSQNLKKECVIDLFNKLYDLNITYGVYDEDGNPGDGILYTQQIDLHADVIAQLTPEDIAIATNKGWTIL